MNRTRTLCSAVACSIFALSVLCKPAWAQEAFVPGIEDLPVMEGLQNQPDGSVVFDNPDGRIVEAYATGPKSSSDVANFYSLVLPRLGWRQTAGLSFLRDDELLTLKITEEAAGVVVLFRLSPAGDE